MCLWLQNWLFVATYRHTVAKMPDFLWKFSAGRNWEHRQKIYYIHIYLFIHLLILHVVYIYEYLYIQCYRWSWKQNTQIHYEKLRVQNFLGYLQIWSGEIPGSINRGAPVIPSAKPEEVAFFLVYKFSPFTIIPPTIQSCLQLQNTLTRRTSRQSLGTFR